MQRCVTEFALGLDPRDASDAQVTRGLGGVLEQLRLAHARVAPKHQRTAHAGSNRGEQVVECLALLDTSYEAHPSIHRQHRRGPDPLMGYLRSISTGRDYELRGGDLPRNVGSSDDIRSARRDQAAACPTRKARS